MTGLNSQTQRGCEEPFAVQFSVFLANRVGRLRELLTMLADADVALYGLSIVESSEWAVLRMICDDPEKARALLKAREPGFTEKESC